jgi:hypothetical protein
VEKTASLLEECEFNSTALQDPNSTTTVFEFRPSFFESASKYIQVSIPLGAYENGKTKHNRIMLGYSTASTQAASLWEDPDSSPSASEKSLTILISSISFKATALIGA